ncbi:MAG: UTP--glucose-1-phosphate uridylyltransferase GalU [Mycoplasma sp.]
MQKITKAVIPAAGYGTRFLPASKTIPKEMFPIIDKPTIHMIVEEAYKSGITDLLFIISRNKHTLMNYFDYNKELNDILLEKNKMRELKLINEPADLMNIQFVIQKEQLGLGHAILTAEKFANNEPFAVLLGDDIVVTTPEQKPALQECIDAYEKYETSVIGVQEVDRSDVDKYGIIKPSKKLEENIIEIDDLVEKPNVDDAPSNFAISGRYILTPEIFDVLKTTKKDVRNEIELTDALRTLNKEKKMVATPFSGRRFDIGQKKGYVEATIYLALRDPDMGEEIKQFIKNNI